MCRRCTRRSWASPGPGALGDRKGHPWWVMPGPEPGRKLLVGEFLAGEAVMTSTVTLRYVGGTRGECGSGGGRGLVNFASVPAGPGFSNLLGGGGAAAVSRSH